MGKLMLRKFFCVEFFLHACFGSVCLQRICNSGSDSWRRMLETTVFSRKTMYAHLALARVSFSFMSLLSDVAFFPPTRWFAYWTEKCIFCLDWYNLCSYELSISLSWSDFQTNCFPAKLNSSIRQNYAETGQVKNFQGKMSTCFNEFIFQLFYQEKSEW